MNKILRIFTRDFGNINQAAILLGFFTLLSQILASLILVPAFVTTSEDIETEFDKFAKESALSRYYIIAANYLNYENWSLQSSNVILELSGHTAKIISINFSPNGKYLATSSIAMIIKVWNINNGLLISRSEIYFDQTTSNTKKKSNKSNEKSKPVTNFTYLLPKKPIIGLKELPKISPSVSPPKDALINSFLETFKSTIKDILEQIIDLWSVLQTNHSQIDIGKLIHLFLEILTTLIVELVIGLVVGSLLLNLSAYGFISRVYQSLTIKVHARLTWRHKFFSSVATLY